MSRTQSSDDWESWARAPRSSRGVFADALAMDLRLQAAHAARQRRALADDDEDAASAADAALTLQSLEAADQGDMDLTLQSLRALASTDAAVSPRESASGGREGAGAGAAAEELEEEETAALDLTLRDPHGHDLECALLARERDMQLSLQELEDLEAANRDLALESQVAARDGRNRTCLHDLEAPDDLDDTLESQDAADASDVDLALQTVEAVGRGNEDPRLRSLRHLVGRGVHPHAQPAEAEQASELDLMLEDSQEAVDGDLSLQDLEVDWRRDEDLRQQEWEATETSDMDLAQYEPQDLSEAWQWREQHFEPAPRKRPPPPRALGRPLAAASPFVMLPDGTDRWWRRDGLDEEAELDAAAYSKKSPAVRYRSPPPQRYQRPPLDAAPPTAGGWSGLAMVPTRSAAHRSPTPTPTPRAAGPAPHPARRRRPQQYAAPPPAPPSSPPPLQRRPHALPESWAYGPPGWEEPAGDEFAEWPAAAHSTPPSPPPSPAGRRSPRAPPSARKGPPLGAAPPAPRSQRAIAPQHRYYAHQDFGAPPPPSHASARADAHEAYHLQRYNCPTLRGDDLFTSFSQAQ